MQLPVPARALTPVTVLAPAASVCPAELLNSVEVRSRFQPAPLPDSSSTLSEAVVLSAWFFPLSVSVGQLRVLGGVRFRPPLRQPKLSMIPPEPTAQPNPSLLKKVAPRLCVVPDVCALQLVPPVVAMIPTLRYFAAVRLVRFVPVERRGGRAPARRSLLR